MRIKKLDPKALSQWVDALIRTTVVHGVQADGDRFAFGPLKNAGDLRLDYDVTKLPPKKYFQPPYEELVRFDAGGAGQSVIPQEPFVLMGVHPYDMAALLQMTRIFAQDNCDLHYITRWNNATIVVSDVETDTSPNVFAGGMGTAAIRDGFDVLLTRVGNAYVVESRTEKGDALLKGIANAPDADPAALAAREQVWERNQRVLRKHKLIPPLKDIPALMEKSYEHPVWERMSKRCYSCGSCVTVCPTCYCFDVRDDVNWDLKSGTRGRSWDGCMLTNFATVTGGHNFRANRSDRYRHRFFRKGKYVPARIGGEIACVGCGRCVTACTAFIANPVDVWNSLLEDA